VRTVEAVVLGYANGQLYLFFVLFSFFPVFLAFPLFLGLFFFFGFRLLGNLGVSHGFWVCLIFFWEGCLGFMVGLGGFVGLGCFRSWFGCSTGASLYFGFWVSCAFCSGRC
jgi:hypothetical protein